MEAIQIEERVIRSVGSWADNSKATRESRFQEDLGFDSLDEIELVMAMEEEFEIEIGDEEAESVKTIGQAVDLIQRKLPHTQLSL